MEEFDPYHEWLGIAPDNGPPNHYQLLGLPDFEGDADRIRDAADGRMAHIRRFQTGPRGMRTQRLLNELAAAKLCLLDARMKATYDLVLRGQTNALRDRDLDDRWEDLLPPGVADAPVAPPPPVEPKAAARPGSIAAPQIQAEPRLPARSQRRPKSVWYRSPVLWVIAGTAIVALVVFVTASQSGSGDNQDAPPKQGTAKRKTTKQPTQQGLLVHPDPDGRILLLPETAVLHGSDIAVNSIGATDVIDDWGKESWVSWDFQCGAPGFYSVKLVYSATAEQVESHYSVQIDDGKAKLPRIREDTGGLFVQDYTIVPISKAGRHTLKIRPTELTSQYLMTLKSVEINKVSGN